MDNKQRLSLLLLFILNTGWITCYNLSDAKTLFDNLTSSYTIYVRPTTKVIIRMEFSILSVQELSVREQTFTVSGWFTLLWDDPQLVWTPADYGNITIMFFNDLKIWHPELVITNAADGVPVIDSDDLSMKAVYSGTVQWDPPGAYVVSCDVDVTYYPFDTQYCYISVSTWSYDNSLIELAKYTDGINFDDYSENGEWDILSTSVTSDESIDRNEGSISRDKIQFNFKLKRKSLYYVISVIFPPMLTSFLGVAVFVLPAESGEKVGYSITVLLALAVLLTIITDHMPTTSKDTSIFGLYLVCMMIFSSFEVLITIFVLRIHHKAEKDLPVTERWQKVANVFLARTSFFHSCLPRDCCRRKNRKTVDVTVGNAPATQNNKHKLAPLRMIDNDNYNGKEFVAEFEKKNMKNRDGDVENSDEDSNADKEYTWPEIALMIDMTTFIFMTLAMILSTLIFLLVLALN